MKSWLKKLGLSMSLDNGAFLSRPSTKGKHRSDDLARFECALDRLDRQLRESNPDRPMPDDLHDSIMRSVRGAQGEENPPRRHPLVGWKPIGASAIGMATLIAILLLLGPGDSDHQAPSTREVTESLDAGVKTLELGYTVTQDVSSQALAPLQKEMLLVQSDAKKVANAVWSSLGGAMSVAWRSDQNPDNRLQYSD